MLTRCVRAVLRRHTAIRSCSSAFLKPRRFYKEVQVQQLDDNLYETHLDSRVLKTPKNQQLHVRFSSIFKHSFLSASECSMRMLRARDHHHVAVHTRGSALFAQVLHAIAATTTKKNGV